MFSVNEGKRSLSEWKKKSLSNVREVWKMQDRYLEMSAEQMFEYLKRRYAGIQDVTDMLQKTDVGNLEIGKAIQKASGSLEYDMEIEDDEALQKDRDMLFALLILPFACFVLDNGYMPEQRNLEDTYLTEFCEDVI